MNNTNLVGRLAKDPEIRTTNTGKTVAVFPIAVDKYAEGKRTADFFDVVAWGKTAEFVHAYFHKGDPIAVIGHLNSRTYTDKNGVNRKVVEVVADAVEFVPGKKDSKPYTEAEAKPIDEDNDLPF